MRAFVITQGCIYVSYRTSSARLRSALFVYLQDSHMLHRCDVRSVLTLTSCVLTYACPDAYSHDPARVP